MKRKTTHTLLLTFLFLLLVSQFVWYRINQHTHPEELVLEQALAFAGSNRPQLEKVLRHYKNDTAKLAAAKYLIRNMPAYYSYRGAMLDSLREVHRLFHETYDYDRKRFEYLRPFPYHLLEKQYDSQHITADYLIENIDFSFDIWEKVPWSEYISFDDFCEFILPYRLKDEPLSDWKKDLHGRFYPVMDSLCIRTHVTDVVAACDSVNRYINKMEWKYFNELNTPHFAADYLLQYRVGSCNDICDLRVYILRALGIPVSTDTYLCSPDLLYAHTWNVVLDTTGHTVPFFSYELYPKRGDQIRKRKGKVYRNAFAIQDIEAISHLNDYPPSMQNLCQKDVSSEYFPANRIDVNCEFVKDRTLAVYLAVFSLQGWHPIDRSVARKGSAIFENLETDLIYTPVYYEDGKIKEAGYPFRLLPQSNDCHYYRPTGEQRQNMVLRRKYPLAQAIKNYMSRMYQGCFEGSNRIDFKDADTLYVIPERPDKNYYSVQLNNTKAYRYIRYISPRSTGDVAELAFFSDSTSTQPLTGEIIGSPIFRNDPVYAHAHVFDGDPLSYFSSAETPGWIGLKLASPQQIRRIEYVPRNDDNFIRKGDLYELMYFGEKGWTSAGIRVGKADSIRFEEVPSGALYWLRNHTRGKEEQVFSFENGQQRFATDRTKK